MESEGYSSDEGGALGSGFQLVAAEKTYAVPPEEVQRMMDDLYAVDPHTQKLFSRKYIEFLMSKPMRKLPDQVGVARRARVAACTAQCCACMVLRPRRSQLRLRSRSRPRARAASRSHHAAARRTLLLSAAPRPSPSPPAASTRSAARSSTRRAS